MILKPEYQGQIIKVNTKAGLITFDTNITKESDYETLYNLGFDFCFEPIEPKYKAPVRYVGVESKKVDKKKHGKESKTQG